MIDGHDFSNHMSVAYMTTTFGCQFHKFSDFLSQAIMRRKKQFSVKRVTTRSITNLAKIAPSFYGALSKSVEISLMEREEWEQRLVDNFWGLDKDLKDRNAEISMMHAEDILSSELEWRERVLIQHHIWDEEYVEQEEMKEKILEEKRAQQRTEHLKIVNSPLPVEDLLHHIWNTDSEDYQRLIPQVATLTDSIMMMSSSLTNSPIPGNGGGLSNSFAGGSVSLTGTNSGSLNNTSTTQQQQQQQQQQQSLLENMKMSVHMEGLQRGREILDSAKGHYRKILKELKMTNQLNARPLSPAGILNNLPPLNNSPLPTIPGGSGRRLSSENAVLSSSLQSNNNRDDDNESQRSVNKTVLATVQEGKKKHTHLLF